MKTIAKVWTFASGSNPDKTYETLQYEDETTSCNCPGWTRHVDPSGNRNCRHIRSVHMGTADADCVSNHDYLKSNKPAPQKDPVAELKKKAKKKSPTVRKIQWK